MPTTEVTVAVATAPFPEFFKGKFGLEIECGTDWDFDEWSGNLPKGWEIDEDGSISCDDDGHAVELKTRPYETTEKDVKEFLKKWNWLYDDHIVEVNNSMGLHIHVSFANKADYFKVCSWDFTQKFQEAYKTAFTREYEKKRMTNHFSEQYGNREGFTSSVWRQVESRNKVDSRYRIVNFNAYMLYKTVEFRVFPAARKAKQGEEYLMFLLNFINDYLKATPDKEVSSEQMELNAKKLTVKAVMRDIETDAILEANK